MRFGPFDRFDQAEQDNQVWGQLIARRSRREAVSQGDELRPDAEWSTDPASLPEMGAFNTPRSQRPAAVMKEEDEMRTLRGAVIVCLAFLLSSCGDERASTTTAPTEQRTVAALQISGKPALGIGESQQLRALVRYSDGSVAPALEPVTWRSSNEAILAVWNDGLVVAMSPGEATVTVVDGKLMASSPITADHRDGDVRRIEGRVLDFVSQTGVPGATLIFRTAGQAFSMPAGSTVSDGAGNFAMTLAAGDYSVGVEDRAPALFVVRVGSPAFRGDFYVNGGACIARYGYVIDDATYRPITGATVKYGGRTATTNAEGFYRIDHPCVGSITGNTTTVEVNHPAYAPSWIIAGRGLNAVMRLDFALRRP